MLFSQIFNKKIINYKNNKVIGYVKDIVIDYNSKKIIFLLFDDIKNIIKKEDPEKIILDLKKKSIPYYNIIKIEKDKIIVKVE